MTQEEKQLLLVDLCTRLPHKVIVNIGKDNALLEGIDVISGLCELRCLPDGTVFVQEHISNIHPYLRLISSMTEEEAGELSAIEPSAIVYGVPEPEMIRIKDDTNLGVKLDAVQKVIDWLNRKMFDWRGLIPLNLALEAKKGMYGKEAEK